MLLVQFAALALAATTLVSGCGGSSKTGSTSTAAANTTTATTASAATTPAPTVTTITIATGTPLARSVWISKGDAICASANTKLNSTTVRSTQDFARLLPQAAAYDHTEATELSKLVPPTAMASDWVQIVTELQKFSELSAKAGEYARVNNLSAAKPVTQAGNTAQRQLVAIAKRDGFKVCSIP
jgi:hypothetical protein